jgi:hypothetical protein
MRRAKLAAVALRATLVHDILKHLFQYHHAGFTHIPPIKKIQYTKNFFPFERLSLKTS